MTTEMKNIPVNEFNNLVQQHNSITTYLQTAAGVLRILSVDDYIYKTEFLSKEETRDTSASAIQKNISAPKFLIVGTPFQYSVWRAACQIPAGKKVSYTDIARMINAPRAVRAVANALGDNKIAYFIPCHRVLRKSGHLGGYYWGLDIKKALLKSEGVL